MHGLGQSSDVFIETALSFALNGFVVHMADLEGHGFTAGNRLDSQSIESNFNIVTTLLTQVQPDLPCFIVASDLGALTVCTYLGINQQVSKRLAGVVYLSPLFGHYNKGNIFEKLLISIIAKVRNTMLLIGSRPLHRLSRNKTYMRQVITSFKSLPLLSAGMAASINRNQGRILRFASQVSYPYLLLLGERDTIVCNKVAKEWH